LFLNDELGRVKSVSVGLQENQVDQEGAHQHNPRENLRVLGDAEQQRGNPCQVLVLLEFNLDFGNLANELLQLGFVVVRMQCRQPLQDVLFILFANVLAVGWNHEVFAAD
jgi:hypothetical protein